VETPVHIVDWVPTFAALTRFRPERDLKWDGTNILSLLTAHTPLPDRPLYSVAPGWRARSIQFGTWKLIATGDGDQRKNELYHLAVDPGETNNLANREPGKLAELLRMLEQAGARDRDALPKD
jgi:arylsulfatase A-like enzyme